MGKAVYLKQLTKTDVLTVAGELARARLVEMLSSYGVLIEKTDVVVNVSEHLNLVRATARGIEIPGSVKLSQAGDALKLGLSFFAEE